MVPLSWYFALEEPSVNACENQRCRKACSAVGLSDGEIASIFSKDSIPVVDMLVFLRSSSGNPRFPWQ